MSDRVFKLFASCIPVRGARRSTICDLQRQSYHLIPNGLFEILTVHRDQSLHTIKEAYGQDEAQTIDQYFAFLEQHELGFWCEDPASFPDLELVWETPEEITNAILDVDTDSCHDYERIIEQLDSLRCRALQVRFFTSIRPRQLEAVLAPTLASRLRSIELLLKYASVWNDASLEEICRRHQRITQIWVHSAPTQRVVRVRSGTVQVAYMMQSVASEADCGEVHPAYFSPTLSTFLESQHCNSCLNRKISVDRRGEIRNCPAMATSFGNIRNTSLVDVVTQPAFRSVWSLHKDQIEMCKDCEFRYICTDCRAYVRDPSRSSSKPAKCSYDPYTATWA